MFYNQNINVPLSLAHNTAEWDNSVIGKLNQETEGNIYIHELQQNELSADYAWRICDAYWSYEDSTVTRFRAYNSHNMPEPYATFGINWQGVPTKIYGRFEYQPKFKQNYYVPDVGTFHTPNTGGYNVCVLDTEYPSEHLAFGMNKAGKQHQCLIVTFKLFKLESGYPNDLDLEVR